jgi:predicted MFS family arabinose efflux permease
VTTRVPTTTPSRGTPDRPGADCLDYSLESGRRRLAVPRRLAFWLLAFVFAATMLGTTLPTPLYYIYQAQWHASAATVTVIFAVYAAAVLATLLLAGRSSDQAGRRPALAVALGCPALSTVAFILAPDEGVLVVGWILSGLAAGLMTGTATAALTELVPASASRRASLVATAANMGGLGLGALIAGLFAQYAPHLATLVFEVYLAVLAVAGLCLLLVPETISPRNRPAVRFAGLGIPQRSPGEFVAAAGAGFAAFALLVLFGSPVPGFLAGVLHQGSHAVQGAVVFLLYAVGTITQVTLSRFSTRRVVLVGLGLFLGALALILAALAAAAMALFLTGTVVGGVAVGAIFLGSLATANRLAPPGRRGADRIRLLRGLLSRHDHRCGRRRGADRIHRNLPGRAGLLAPARRAEPVLVREHPPNPVALGRVVPQYPICQPKEICNV